MTNEQKKELIQEAKEIKKEALKAIQEYKELFGVQ